VEWEPGEWDPAEQGPAEQGRVELEPVAVAQDQAVSRRTELPLTEKQRILNRCT
jgi:hypothetical protein